MSDVMSEIPDLVDLYLREHVDVARNFPVLEVDRLCKLAIGAYARNRTIYVAANGGPAGFCDNLACDLHFHPFVSDDKSKAVPGGVQRMKVVNLAASPAALTGVMNDLGPSYIFSAQLEGHIRGDDLLIAISGSGNSGNILEAIAVAKKVEATTVAITRGTGGKCKEIADLTIVIPGTSKFPGQVGKNDNNFHFEDFVVSISHIIVGILQKHVREKHGLA